MIDKRGAFAFFAKQDKPQPRDTVVAVRGGDGRSDNFHESGKVIADIPGVFKVFHVRKLEGDNGFTLLRQELSANPYFAGVESFKPERRKTDLVFYAKD